MTNATLRGKPDAGNPHVRFDEWQVASAKPRRGSLLYKTKLTVLSVGLLGTYGLFARTIQVDEGETTTLSEALSGTEELVKTGAGTLVLGNANSGWTGAIDVQEGTLQSTFANLGKTGDLRVRADARILYTGTNVNVPTPTRHGYLAGTLAFASDFSYMDGSWYVFKDVTLEGDLTLENSGKFVGWGTLDMGGHTITAANGTLGLPRMSITNPGRIVKSKTYLTFADKSGVTAFTNVVVELRDGVTLNAEDFKKARLGCEIRNAVGMNWIMSSSTGTASTEDNVFAGPIDLASGTELQTWAKTDGKEPIVVESAIGGEGTFSTATQASSETILRGAEPVGSDVAVVVNTKLTVEPARCAAFRPKTVNLRNKNNLVFADPPDSEAVAWTVARTSVAKDATGCIRVRLTGSGENVYNGPFSNGLLYVESPNGTVVSTNAPTAELIVGANSANLGTWVIGDAPSASVTLGGIYFNHNLVFRDAGTITVPSWICSSLTTRGNVEPYRLVLEGLTHLDVGTVYAGRGGDNGLGIVTIDDPASVEGCFLVGTENNDRGAVYLRGGQVRNRQNGGGTWSGIGVKTTSNGAWIQRGGTNEIALQTWVGNTPHAYGAFIQHGGLTRVTTGGMLLVGCGGRGVFYQDGGVFTNALPIGGRGVNVNIDGYSGLTDEASFTLAGMAEFLSPGESFGTWKTKSLTRYNLNGGRLTVPYLYLCDRDFISGNYPDCTIHFSFNGGTLRTVGNATSCLFGMKLDERAHPTTLTVYEGGATIDLAGNDRRALFGFAGPTGLGVKSVTLPETIGGVALADIKAVGPLKLFFVGGNGSADAMVDFDDRTGKTLGVKMLCSGCGYTEAPKAYVVSYAGTATNECAVEMYEPKGGGLTKKGASTLWLDQPNTYPGPTVIEAGTLRFSAGCIPPAADITIAEGAELWPEINRTDNVIDTLRGTGVGWYDVTLTNRLVVSYADARAGKSLWFKRGAITVAGARVVLTDPELLTDEARSVKILTADNGFAGEFTLDEQAANKGWALRMSGNALRLVNLNRGMMLLVR